MSVLDTLYERGFVHQLTHEEEIRELLAKEKITFYIGFDPTADSLHVGHFMALCLMKRLQMAGNKPIALIGGGTAMIGDPSGRTDMRQMMTKETIQHNVDCFKKITVFVILMLTDYPPPRCQKEQDSPQPRTIKC